MSDDNDALGRRALMGGGAVAGVVAAVGLGAAACGSSSAGSKVNGNANNANDLQNQEEKLTVTAFDAVNKIPDQEYPADRLKDSLEMKNLRRKLLTFNDGSKQGWFYGISQGRVLLKIEVMGKVSSTQSAMTTDTLVYKDQGTGGGGNVTVPGPGDDLSYGRNEGGDRGVFFYTPTGGYMAWAGDWAYSDFELNVGSDGVLTLAGSGTPTKSAV